MGKNKGDKKENENLSIYIMLFAAIIVTLVFVVVFYKMFLSSTDFNIDKIGSSLTGFVVSNRPSYDPTKNCIFDISGKTLSMYNCNIKEDCNDFINDLKKDKDVLENFDVSNIKVVDCISND